MTEQSTKKTPAETRSSGSKSLAKKAIVQQVSQEKIMSTQSYTTRNVLLALLLVFCFSFALVSFISFSRDIVGLLTFELPPEVFLQLLPQTLFELAVFAILAIVGAYVLFRQTDWPLVRQSGGLVIGFVLGFIILSGAVFANAFPTESESLLEATEDLPFLEYRDPRAETILDRLEEEGRIVGEVSSIEEVPGGFEYVIENPLREEVCFVDRKLPGVNTGEVHQFRIIRSRKEFDNMNRLGARQRENTAEGEDYRCYIERSLKPPARRFVKRRVQLLE
jgi:hypothetical protein